MKTLSVLVELNVPCEMRDGTLLYCDVFRPQIEEDVPVLLTRHPYGKGVHNMDKAYFDHLRVASSGYIVVIQDVRGRYTSEGQFVPEFQEVLDGADSVEWAASLPGANGLVGMFGRSYHALTQWAAAKSAPKSLKAIVPGFSPGHRLIDGLFIRGGAHELGSHLYWANRHSLDFIMRASAGNEYEFEKLMAEYSQWDRLMASGEVYWNLPLKYFASGPGLTTESAKSFAVAADDLSRETVETAGTYSQLDVRAFLVGGWYDVFLGSTLAQYKGMRNAAAANGSQGPHLVIGPWTHINQSGLFGQTYFGVHSSTAMTGVDLDLTGQHIRWFDAELKGNRENLNDVSPVRVFVMGSDRWVDLECFPPSDTEYQKWCLQKDGGLAHSTPENADPSTFIYNPLDPVPTIGGCTLLPSPYPAGPQDQSPLDSRSDILRFDSEILEKPLTIMGDIEVRLFAASTACDTDFVARLIDVGPDERKILIADGIVRARFRDTYRQGGEIIRTAPALIAPGEVYGYWINLWATAYQMEKGHRIRLEITSSSFPRWDRNLNTGKDPFTDSDTQVATQSIHHSLEFASYVTIPVWNGANELC